MATTLAANEVVYGNQDKVTRYGWRLADRPGELRMVPKGALTVDHSYQRDVRATDGKVKRIAAEWSWVACGAIIVGNRDGKLHVIDGQHRVMAALKRSDVGALPCIVFETQDIQQEADGFLRANRNRKPMNTVDAFKAQLVAGNKVAVKVKQLADESGLTICNYSGAGTMACVGLAMSCIEADEDAFVRAWPSIVAACAGGSLHNNIVKGMFYVETHLADGQSLGDARWRKRIAQVGRDAIIRGIAQAVSFRGSSGANVVAEGILAALNKGLRTATLEISA